MLTLHVNLSSTASKAQIHGYPSQSLIHGSILVMKQNNDVVWRNRLLIPVFSTIPRSLFDSSIQNLFQFYWIKSSQNRTRRFIMFDLIKQRINFDFLKFQIFYFQTFHIWMDLELLVRRITWSGYRCWCRSSGDQLTSLPHPHGITNQVGKTLLHLDLLQHPHIVRFTLVPPIRPLIPPPTAQP